MKKNIKHLTFGLFTAFCLIIGMVSCEKDIFDKELYEKIFSILSDDDKIFEIVHPYEDGGSQCNVSIYCSGTKPLEENVQVELEIAGDSLFNRYNDRIHDLDKVNYARLLSPSHYSIQSMNVTMSAGQTDPYVKMPIKVNAELLSPDSVYFIPLRIKSVSGNYKINANKRQILYRPLLENRYAEQKNISYYGSKGTEFMYARDGVTLDATYRKDFGATKVMYPIGARKVRIALKDKSILNAETGRASLDLINRHSVVIEVTENNKLKIYPYNDEMFLYDIEMLPDEVYYDNTFRIENGRDCFFLNFRFKENFGTGKRWYKLNERLRRE